MAARYRDFLMKERGAVRVGSRSTGAGEALAGTGQPQELPRLHLGLLMGTERKTWFLADMISMTTFDQARAILTGALAGAQSGLSGIPQRFIDGLENGTELLEQARRLAVQVVAGA